MSLHQGHAIYAHEQLRFVYTGYNTAQNIPGVCAAMYYAHMCSF